MCYQILFSEFKYPWKKVISKVAWPKSFYLWQIQILMRVCHPFLFGSNLAEKIKSQTEINSLSRKIVVSPPNPAYKPRVQMSRGKRKVYLRKRSYAGRRGPRQGDWSLSQLQKEIKSSQTQMKVGGH